MVATVRFAPSPTGLLHIGGLRTALFNFLFARKNNGKFILRIEDTDKSREVRGAVENIKETLRTFGLNWDVGPIFQSERLKTYHEHASRLVAQGDAYKCGCSEERIADLKKHAQAEKRPFRYDKHCLKNPAPSTGSGSNHFVIRQNVPEEGITSFEDLVYGKIQVANSTLDDGILVKSDGYPVYNFANVIDDHLMEITHVIRGEEFIPSTPKHILLYKSFGWQVPQFAHLPLLVDKKRQKLSKRSGDAAVKEYVEKGYLPEAILNFIAFLGWNPKTEQEIFSLDELIKAFDLEKVNKSAAVFDLEKLNWFNSHYIKEKPLSELLKYAQRYFPVTDTSPYPEEFLEKILEIEKGRLNKLSEVGERAGYFFQEPEYNKDLLSWKDMTGEEIKKSLEVSKKIIFNFQFSISKKEIEKTFFQEIGEGDKGTLLWPLRVALTGLRASPGPFEILEAFFCLQNGKETVLKRIQKAIDKI
ncbi:MAG: glutamate--tRNA ligase [bacterium]|nr:glutamate--tRNA ligase [bacterium]